MLKGRLVVSPTVAEIDVAAFAHNVRSVRACLSSSCDLMAVVKADAYGHGAAPLALVALREGAAWLAVARCQEGMSLRHHGIDAPILVLGAVCPEEIVSLLAYRLTPVVSSSDEVHWLEREAGRLGVCPAIHVKIDTGMGRLGVMPDQVRQLLDCLDGCPHLSVEGLMTHLATADSADVQTVRLQLRRFCHVVQSCIERGCTPRYVHAANSAALYRYPESHGTLVRVGLALYGSHPFDAPAAAALQPVLTWKTRLVRIQEVPTGAGISYGHTFMTSRASRIGTLSVGYADGLCRKLSNTGEVLVQGQRAPLVGQITMDMCMIDLTDIPSARVGDEVVLIGVQGSECLTADEMAWRCGGMPYEVFCAIGPRVARRYIF
jgi:alanine racemase